jgi:hypothetical protein
MLEISEFMAILTLTFLSMSIFVILGLRFLE